MNTENSAGKEEHPTPQAIFKGRPTSHFDPHLGRFLGTVHGVLCTVSSGVFGLQGGYGSIDRGGELVGMLPECVGGGMPFLKKAAEI